MNGLNVYVTSSASAFGSRVIPSEEVDQAFGMPVGKLKKRAGIVSLAYAADNEDVCTLGARCSQEALAHAKDTPENVDWLLAATETHHAYPSLSALLHARLSLREDCGALDVGSGCLSLVQALAVAQVLLQTGRAKKIMVTSADVHSKTLGPGRTAGEFGGLFGDGASAFLLTSAKPSNGDSVYELGEFHFGCASKYAEAICVSDPGSGALDIQFDGEALSRAAVNCMEKVLEDIENRSGIARAKVGAFATHQPNPRLVTLLAKQLGVPLCTFPPIGATRGNLGSSMCGAALHEALRGESTRPADERQPIFLASLGPGLLFGGGWMEPVSV